MVDIALDPLDESDILYENSDFQLVDGAEAIRQHVLIRLRFFQGEYFLDQKLGVPYFQQILGKGISLPVVRSLIQETIIETPGINEITSFDLVYNSASRSISITFSASTDLNEELDFTEEFLIGDI